MDTRVEIGRKRRFKIFDFTFVFAFPHSTRQLCYFTINSMLYYKRVPFATKHRVRITIYGPQFTNFNILSPTAQTFKKRVFMFASLLITRSRRYHPYRRASGHGCPHGLSTVIDFASLAAEGSYTTNSEQEMRRPRSISVWECDTFVQTQMALPAIRKKNAEMHSRPPGYFHLERYRRTIRPAKYRVNFNILYLYLLMITRSAVLVLVQERR